MKKTVSGLQTGQLVCHLLLLPSYNSHVQRSVLSPVCGDGVDVKVLDLWHAATTRGTAYIAAPLAAVYTASRDRRQDAAARHCAAASVGPWVDSYQPFTTRSPLPKS